MIFSINALSLQTGQNNNLLDYEQADKGNIYYKIDSGLTDITIITTTFNITYDIDFEFVEVNEDFYIIIDNFYENMTYRLQYTGDLNSDNSIFIRNVTLQEIGKYYFKFSPTTIGESSRLFIDMIPSPTGVFAVTYQEEKPRGFNSVIIKLVNAFDDIIEINVQFWRILFYVIMFILITGFIFTLFGVALAIFGYINKLKNTKRKRKGDDD